MSPQWMKVMVTYAEVCGGFGNNSTYCFWLSRRLTLTMQQSIHIQSNHLKNGAGKAECDSHIEQSKYLLTSYSSIHLSSSLLISVGAAGCLLDFI